MEVVDEMTKNFTIQNCIDDILLKEQLRNSQLFDAVTKQEMEDIFPLVSWEVRKFFKGEIVNNELHNHRGLGILLTGKINAMKYLLDGRSILLKRMYEGCTFGLGGIFGQSERPLSYLEVIELCHIVFISENDIFKIMSRYDIILKNYLKLVNSKVQFLNKKIEVLSQSAIEDRLMTYIYQEKMRQEKDNHIICHLGKTALADFLGVSRASLYRSIIQLENKRVIRCKGKRIEILIDLE